MRAGRLTDLFSLQDFVRAQEARRCMPADFAVAAKQGSADGDGAGADGSSAFGEHSLPQMDGHMHEDSEGECRGHTGDAGNDEVLERSGSPSNVGIEDDANASRHSSSSSVAGGSGEVDGIVLEKEHVTNTGMNIHGGAHSNVAATHEDEEVACSVRLDDDEKAHQEVEVEERGPAGMDSKNYVFDFQKSNWIVDATEKGNVSLSLLKISCSTAYPTASETNPCSLLFRVLASTGWTICESRMRKQQSGGGFLPRGQTSIPPPPAHCLAGRPV